MTHSVRVLQYGPAAKRITGWFLARIDILRFNASPRPASWLYRYNFSGITRPGQDHSLVPRLIYYPLHLNKMAKTASGLHSRMTYHDMVHLFTSGFESTFIRFLSTFHFLLHMKFIIILVLICLRTCARIKQQLSRRNQYWIRNIGLLLNYGMETHNKTGLLRLGGSYVIYSWTRLEIQGVSRL